MAMHTIKRGSIILLGDSLTQFGFNSSSTLGFGNIIAERYQRRADVMNRGFAGYNTRFIKERLEMIEESLNMKSYENIELLTIFFGANDSADAKVNQVQHVPVAEYRENLKYIVNEWARKKLGVKRIIILTPPPVYAPMYKEFARQKLISRGIAFDEAKNPELLQDRSSENVSIYAKAAVDLASELSIPSIDVFNY